MNVQEIIKSAIPKYLCFFYIDYRDELTLNQLTKLNDVLNMKVSLVDFRDHVSEGIWDWMADAEAEGIDTSKKDYIIPALEKHELDVDKVLEDEEDFIRESLLERAYESFDPVGDLIGNTGNQPIRVQMYSNYEGLDSGWHLGRYGVQYEHYFKHVVDFLYLNPARVKQALAGVGIKCSGRFPNLGYREGKEFVSYQSFAQELENTTSSINTLTFIGMLNLKQLEDYHGKITFPAGNDCGLFDNCNGAGGMLSMKLLRDLTIDFNKAQYGETEFDSFSVFIDKTSGYSIDDVYGPTQAFWGEQVKLS